MGFIRYHNHVVGLLVSFSAFFVCAFVPQPPNKLFSCDVVAAPVYLLAKANWPLLPAERQRLGCHSNSCDDEYSLIVILMKVMGDTGSKPNNNGLVSGVSSAGCRLRGLENSFHWGQIEPVGQKSRVDCNPKGLGSDPSTLVHGLWENTSKTFPWGTNGTPIPQNRSINLWSFLYRLVYRFYRFYLFLRLLS